MNHLEYGSNLEIATKCKAAKRDVLVVPVLDGPEVVIKYTAEGMQLDEFTDLQREKIRRCKVPKSVFVDQKAPTWANHFHVKSVRVKFKYVNKHMVAVDATTNLGKLTNHLSTLNLLYGKGFQTLIGLCSWMNVSKFEKKKRLIAALDAKLEDINRVIQDGGPPLWGSSELRSANFAFLPTVNTVELIDAIGFVPEAAKSDPRIASVYKL